MKYIISFKYMHTHNNVSTPIITYDIMGKTPTQPREKMVLSGAEVLSDQELLSIILGSGIKGVPVGDIAKTIITKLDYPKEHCTLSELKKIKGLGTAKALAIIAAIELGRRLFIPRKWKIRSPQDLLPLLTHYSDREQEHFIVFTLNGANEIISHKIISVGLLNRTLVHPREVFTLALADRAAAIILAHNHPSGNVQPSKEDVLITKNLIKASEILNISILDHIIFSIDAHFSFLSERIL